MISISKIKRLKINGFPLRSYWKTSPIQNESIGNQGVTQADIGDFGGFQQILHLFIPAVFIRNIFQARSMRRILKHRRPRPPISFGKRAVDISTIILTSPVWFPLFLACGIWIKLVSKGNFFFLQKRVGYKKEVFTIVKFRTMRENAETTVHDQYARMLAETAAPMHKLDSKDSRLIFGGGFLRASGLDELPQFLNVIRGDMSLVGPRPCLPVELAGYRNSHRKRFDGLPGITGNWQVNGKNSTNFRRMIALDILYINNISVKTDLAILAKTAPALCREIMELFKRPSVPQYGGSEQVTDTAPQAHRIPIESP